MIVNPDDVRLQPNNETPYAWQVDDPDLKPFFGKSLSKHSIGAYMELCSAVGQSFRAVHRDEAVKVRSHRRTCREILLLRYLLGYQRQAADLGRREDFVGESSRSRKGAKSNPAR
jgi:hypothetical protein